MTPESQSVDRKPSLMTSSRLEQERAATAPGDPISRVAPAPGDPPRLAPRRRFPLPRGLALHLALSLFFTWPLVLNLGGNGLTPGFMVEDRDQNLWNLWWVKTALVDLHIDPFHTNWIYWPDGVSLQFHTLNIFNGLVSIPFQGFLPLPVIYNGIVFFSFVLTGWGAYRLLAYILARRPAGAPAAIGAAAAVGSSIFAYSAYHLATQRGLLQLISLEWVPFYLLALLRAAHEGPGAADRRALARYFAIRIAPAALFLLLVALVDWYYVMYTLLFTAFYGLFLVGLGLYATFRPGTPPPVADATAGGRRDAPAGLAGRLLRGQAAALRVVLVVVVFFVLAAPLLLPMFAELRQATYMRPAPGVAVENSADLLAFFLPPRFAHPWSGLSDVRGSWPFGNNQYEVYIGYVALGLALYGLLGRRPIPAGPPAPAGGAPGPALPPRVFWGVGAAIFALLALGPVLQVNGVPQPWLQPMPYNLIERIPGFNISRSPDRFAMPLMLCLAVLAGYGVLRLAGRAPGGRPAWVLPGAVGAGLLALLLVELWPAPYPQLPAPIPAYYQVLGQDPADYAILELPREDSYWHGAFRMYFQTAHHKRIFYGYISREFYHPFLSSTPGFMELQYPDGLGDLFADGPNEWLTALAQYRTRYVVLYKAGWRPKPPGDETAAYRQEILKVLGAGAAQPVHSDADLDLYQVPPPAHPVPFLSLGSGWGSREAGPAESHRWIRNSATLRLDSPQAWHGFLVFHAVPLGARRTLIVRRDAGPPTTLTVDGQHPDYRFDLGSVPAGTSTISLDTPEPVVSPKDLGMNNDDTRLLGIAFSQVRLEAAP